MNKTLKQTVALLCVIAILAGCQARRAFTTTARAGETVVLPVGWYPELRRDDLTLVFTDELAGVVTYLPGNTGIRAVANMYPDPVSKFIVEPELSPFSQAKQDVGILNSAVTNGNKEYSQSSIMIDLPTTLSTGITTIDITSAGGEIFNQLKVRILPDPGSSNPFNNYNGFTLDDSHFQYLERAAYHAVDFSGTTIPHAIQIDLTHGADLNNGGTGEAYVAIGRSDLKHATWSDNGTDTLRVILMPSGIAAVDDMQHFRFYVAGGLTGLTLGPVTAFDINGNTVAGVTANLTANP